MGRLLLLTVSLVAATLLLALAAATLRLPVAADSGVETSSPALREPAHGSTRRLRAVVVDVAVQDATEVLEIVQREIEGVEPQNLDSYLAALQQKNLIRTPVTLTTVGGGPATLSYESQVIDAETRESIPLRCEMEFAIPETVAPNAEAVPAELRFRFTKGTGGDRKVAEMDTGMSVRPETVGVVPFPLTPGRVSPGLEGAVADKLVFIAFETIRPVEKVASRPMAFTDPGASEAK